MRAGFMAQHRHDLLLWGEHEDLLLPGDNADLSDVAVTDGNDTYTNGAVKGAQGEDGAQQVAQQHTQSQRPAPHGCSVPVTMCWH